MPRFTLALLALATLSASALAQSPSYMQSQPAPIQRGYNTPPSPPRITNSQPAQGIFLRAGANASVQTVAASADRTELRVERGVANVSVHHPAEHSQILVDLPGGQVDLLKDGFYTFNATTNTARVLKGEAEAFPGTAPSAKPIKIKEDHAITFGGPQLRSVEFAPFQASTDLLPGARGFAGQPGYGYGYGYGPYGDGFYGYPYYAGGWDYPYGWGYPYWGFGYPFGWGVGFAYYGGFGGFHRFR